MLTRIVAIKGGAKDENDYLIIMAQLRREVNKIQPEGYTQWALKIEQMLFKVKRIKN
jgi:hypothetical protein